MNEKKNDNARTDKDLKLLNLEIKGKRERKKTAKKKFIVLF